MLWCAARSSSQSVRRKAEWLENRWLTAEKPPRNTSIRMAVPGRGFLGFTRVWGPPRKRAEEGPVPCSRTAWLSAHDENTVILQLWDFYFQKRHAEGKVSHSSGHLGCTLPIDPASLTAFRGPALCRPGRCPTRVSPGCRQLSRAPGRCPLPRTQEARQPELGDRACVHLHTRKPCLSGPRLQSALLPSLHLPPRWPGKRDVLGWVLGRS